MFQTIKKRDGRRAKFDASKITNAIAKAGAATGEFDAKQAERLTAKVIAEAEDQIMAKMPTVEQIQDIVEQVLLASKFKKTAKAYIIYRDQREKVREIHSSAQIDLMDQYLDQLDWQVRENSNMGYSLQGLRNYVASEVTKNYWLNKVYSKEVGDAHKSSHIHIHDLDSLSAYCVGWDLSDLLREGFTGAEGKVSSKPAKHFRTALGQIVNFFYTLQGEAAGAQAFSNLDTYLAPFIRYDGLNQEQVKQALQEFIFNMSVPTRVGFQTPFTNVTLDVTVPRHLAGTPVVIAGEMKDENYGDFQEEMNMFNRAFLEVMANGDASGRVFTFPIPTINITKEFDWDNPVVNDLWEITAKYGIPYFSNFINSDMSPEDTRSMCCRLRIDNRKLEVRGGGLFGANPLTGSIGVVTLNMPRLALESKNLSELKKKVGHYMDIARDSLEVKRKTVEQFTEINLYPYSKYYLRDIKKATGKYWTNHFGTIGLLGMNEALEDLLGAGVGTEKGKKAAEEVMDFMRDKLVAYQVETGNQYNLEATPGEGTTRRFAHADQRDFDDPIFANGRGKDVKVPFYTNSTHLPVNFTDDIFELLDLQDNLQTKYTGGTVIHFFLGERVDDPAVIKALVKKICENYRLPYFSFTPSFSVCKNDGYLKGEQPNCKKCGAECEIYSRVVGFLRPVKQWNDSKQAEFEMRKHYRTDSVKKVGAKKV
ncbi:ribonucleoside triphosphate reductase [Candidatus Saccharibacteria bacterium]|nr:ribonucleoside triphosphate reductase [Candidatus Saccharibacteria bacterium]MCL1962950.1 ribonucleoside triphosphate reductase [Candidatus Saccharibacteria bacterium]MCL1963404.1 ribonucleoside triphosphate reductase [Candidatus Saccharibacteria bacterium]